MYNIKVGFNRLIRQCVRCIIHHTCGNYALFSDLCVNAPVAAIASATVSNTGRLRCFLPPLPGDTPPTIIVPYSMA